MPVAFGFSVGDFIAALNLVNTVIEAVNNSRGSSATYRALIRELYVLESTLLRVKNLEFEESQESEKRALEQAASQCQHAIDDFLTKIQAYQPHLRAEGSGNCSLARAKDAWMKIKWAFCKEEDVEKFKADLRGHSASIQLLLQTIEMRNSSIQAEKEDQQHRMLAGQIQDASVALMARVSSVSNGVLRCIQQGGEHLGMATNIMRTNFQIFNMVLDIHKFISRLPSQIQRDQPVYMIDAFGRSSPFHLEFIRSAEGLIAVLRVNFEAAGAGTEKIDHREFVFEDASSRREIDITKNWESCFRPGQRVTMSVVFQNVSQNITSTCPNCHSEQEGSPDQDIECEMCYIVFRRIMELPQNMAPVQSRVHDSNGAKKQTPFSESWSSTFDTKSVTSPKADELENLSLFRRVRIIPKEEAHKCKLWALWNNFTGTKTLEGIGNVCVRTIKSEPFLELIGDDENETLNETLIFESLSRGKCYFQRMEPQRIAVSGYLTHPVYLSQAPLAHALDFKESDWCDTIWKLLPKYENLNSGIPNHLWHNYSQAKPPSRSSTSFGSSKPCVVVHNSGGQTYDTTTSSPAGNTGFYS